MFEAIRNLFFRYHRSAALCFALILGWWSGIAFAAGAPMPGLLVPVGEHRLHLNCQGSGLPAVILDSGLGGSSLEWSRVQPILARNHRVCAYDRAGYGWSEGGPLPRTSERIVFELNALLRNAAIPPPFILVGHSFGGLNVRLYASYFPDQVAGLVLVDAAHEDQFDKMAMRGDLGSLPVGGNFFLTSVPDVPHNLPASVYGLAREMNAQYKTHRAFRGELSAFRVSAAQIKQATVSDAIPVAVLTRGRRVWPDTDAGERMEIAWRELQIDLVRNGRVSRHIVAERSGHYVHLDQPELIGDAVRWVAGELDPDR